MHLYRYKWWPLPSCLVPNTLEFRNPGRRIPVCYMGVRIVCPGMAPPPDARTWIDRLHLFQPAWLMRWWYIVMLVLNIVTIGH